MLPRHRPVPTWCAFSARRARGRPGSRWRSRSSAAVRWSTATPCRCTRGYPSPPRRRPRERCAGYRTTCSAAWTRSRTAAAGHPRPGGARGRPGRRTGAASPCGTSGTPRWESSGRYARGVRRRCWWAGATTTSARWCASRCWTTETTPPRPQDPTMPPLLRRRRRRAQHRCKRRFGEEAEDGYDGCGHGRIRRARRAQ